MKKTRKPGLPEAIKFGLLELVVVLIGLVFVRKEVYLRGQFSSMILHWQEYALLMLMFIDGIFRGFGELQGQANYASPFRKKYLQFLLPFTLFLFVSTSSLCDKLNAMAIHEEWWRDIGVAILAAGVFLTAWSQIKRPKGLEAPIPRQTNEAEPGPDENKQNQASKAADTGATSSATTDSTEQAPMTAPQEITKTETSDDIFADKEEIETAGPWSLLRYPGRSALLLELVGVSMALSAWLPLLTLPGLLVMFKWELSDVEAFRISQFGQKYLRYKDRSWLLIPYIY